MIAEGRVEVNGEPVIEQGRRVDPARDTIRVDGKRIPPPRIHVYLMLNKPKGVVCTMDDPEGRRTVADLLTTRKERLFHVGRLDTDTEGMLLLTNDGDFAQRMSHPKYELTKTYVAEIEGVLDQKTAALAPRRHVGGRQDQARPPQGRRDRRQPDDGDRRPAFAATASSGACSRRSGTSCGRSRASRSARCAWAGSRWGSTATSRDELGALLDAVKL